MNFSKIKKRHLEVKDRFSVWVGRYFGHLKITDRSEGWFAGNKDIS